MNSPVPESSLILENTAVADVKKLTTDLNVENLLEAQNDYD